MMPTIMEDSVFGFNNVTEYIFIEHQLCALEAETKINKKWWPLEGAHG